MHRRTFVSTAVLTFLAGPVAAQTVPSTRVRWVGYLGDGFASARASINLDPFRDALSKLGYVEGRNLFIDAQWSEGQDDRLAVLAAGLVSRNVDVIVTHGLPGARAAKNATTSIPIVVAVIADIVGSGIVASLSRPGGNITGMTDQLLDLSGKEVELLRQMIPSIRRVGVIWNRKSETASKISQLMAAAARDSGLDVTSLGLQNIDELDAVLEFATRAQVGGVLVVHDPLTVGNRRVLAEAILRKGLPAICGSPWLAEAGLLMAYGPDQTKMFRRAADYVDKILKGAMPGELPVEQPTTFELVVNQKTAKAIGVVIPQALLLRADEVIR